jgi:hypothetical protein
MSKINGMIIDGIAASEAIDSSGEILDVGGCDITDFNNGTAVLNYEHSGSSGHKDGKESPIDIIGKIIYGKKIFKEADCEDERQKMFWKSVQLPYIYIKARLYDGAGHPGAMAAAAMIRDHLANDEKILLRYSIEGSTLDRKDNKLLRSVARRVAATIKPCNRSCDSGVVSDPNAGQAAVKNVEALAEGLLGTGKKEESTKKFENPAKMLIGAHEMEWSFTSLGKTMTAGMPTGAPSTLTQGEALQVSDMSSRKKRLKDKLRKAMLEKVFAEHNMAGFLDVFVKAEDDDEEPDENDEEIELDEPEDMAEPTQDEAESIQNATVKIIRRDATGKELDKPLIVDGNSFQRFKPHSIAYAAKKRNGPMFAPAAGIYFDSDTGVLHTGKASMPMYIPTDKEYQEILSSPEINEPHNEAMKHWTRLHEMLHKGEISPTVMMYASIFSGLSPNNPVPMQEYAFSHVVDMFNEGLLDTAKLKRLYDPSLAESINTGDEAADEAANKERRAKIKALIQDSPEYQEFQRRVQGYGYHKQPEGVPLSEHARGFYAGPAGAPTRYIQRAGKPPENAASKEFVPESGTYQKGLFGPFGKFLSIQGYDFMRPVLEQLVQENPTSGRSVARGLLAIAHAKKKVGNRAKLRSEIPELAGSRAEIEDPHKIFVQGYAPKTIRYFLGMMGFGDMLVPDTHLTRHLFDLERDKVVKQRIDVGMRKLSMDPNASPQDRALALRYIKKVDTGKGKKDWQEFLPHSHVRSIMWNAAAHDEMAKLDDYYERNHPAIKYTAQKIFGDPSRTHHAIFPGFWLHWLTINPHEAVRKGVKYKGTHNAGTHHVPYFMLVDKLHEALGYPSQTKEYADIPFTEEGYREQLAREHEAKLGTREPERKEIPQKKSRKKPMKKSEDDVKNLSVATDMAKLLTANKIVEDKLGEGYGRLYYFQHVLPKLLDMDQKIQKKEKKGKTKETEGSWSGGKQDHGMPDAADEFIDTFEEVADNLKPSKGVKAVLKTKKSESWFQDLYTMKDFAKAEGDPLKVDESQVDPRTDKEAQKMVVGMNMLPKAVKGITYGKGTTQVSFWADGADGNPVFVKGEHGDALNGAGTEAATADLAHQLGLGNYFPKVALVYTHQGKRAVIEGIVGMHDPSLLKSEHKAKLIEKQDVEDLQKLGIFDAICKNNDRRFGNYGYRPDGKIVLIDHADNFAPHNYGFDSLMPEYLTGVDTQAKPSVVQWLHNIDMKKMLDTLDHYGIIEDEAHRKDIVEHIADLKMKITKGSDIKLIFDERG